MKHVISQAWTLAASTTAKSTYLLFTGNLADSVFAFLFTIISFRLLTTADFGVFSAINNFFFTAVLVLDLGIGQALLRFIPQAQKSSQPETARLYLFTAVFIRLLVAAVFTALVLFLSGWLSRFGFHTPERLAVVLSGLAIIAFSWLDILNFGLLARRQFLHSTLVAASISFFRFFFVGLVWIIGWKYSVTAAFIVTLAAPVVGIILSTHWLQMQIRWPLKWSIVRSLVGFGGWLGLAKVITTVTNRLDIQIVLLYVNAATAGVYSVATRLVNFYPIIITSFVSVIATRLAAVDNRQQLLSYVRKIILAQLLLASGMVFGIFVAKPVITLLFGPASVESVPFFRALTMANLPYLFLILPQSLLIYYFKKPKVIGILGLTQLFLVIILNLILVPRVSAMAPPMALGISNTLVLLVSLVIVWQSWK